MAEESVFDVIPEVVNVSIAGRRGVQIKCCECGESFQQQRRLWVLAQWPEACPACRRESEKKPTQKCLDCSKPIWSGSAKCKSCAQKQPRPNCTDCGVVIGLSSQRCLACHNKRQNKGLSRARTLFQNSSEWRFVRERCFIRDGYTCGHCGKTGGYLEAHHIQHWSKVPALRLSLENLKTLCRPCHEIEHWGERRA